MGRKPISLPARRSAFLANIFWLALTIGSVDAQEAVTNSLAPVVSRTNAAPPHPPVTDAQLPAPVVDANKPPRRVYVAQQPGLQPGAGLGGLQPGTGPAGLQPGGLQPGAGLGGLPPDAGLGPGSSATQTRTVALTSLGTDGSTQLRRLRAPNLIGDFFGGGAGRLDLNVNNSFHVPGRIVSGSNFDATLVYELDGTPPFNDFTTMGLGRDISGDGNADTFDMAEPVPPTSAPVAPGPAFTYQGGTVVYTNSPTMTTPQDGVFDDDELWFASYDYALTVELPPSVGVSVRRTKVAENNSPLPRDRVYFDFKHFRDVQGPYGDVSRFTYGYEKTFHQGRSSLDTRLPFAATLDSTQAEAAVGRNIGLRAVEFGNVTFILKHILRESEQFLLAGGLGVTVPTGADSRLVLTNGQQVLVRKNEAVHLMPYFAWLWTPSERFFFQSFLQVDVDANGDPVRASLAGGVLPEIGVIQDSTLFFADVSGGYWLARHLRSQGWLRGVAAIGELHYNTSVSDADIVRSTGIVLTNRTRRFDVLNATVGLLNEIGRSTVITAAMSFPMRQQDDRQFDNEIAVQATIFF